LAIASAESKWDVVKLLLKSKASANVFDKDGNSPIYYANSVDIIKSLLDAKADIQTTTKVTNLTALHRAAISGNKEICKYLINHHIDATIENKTGFTAATLAENNNHNDLAIILRRAEYGSQFRILKEENRQIREQLKKRDEQIETLMMEVETLKRGLQKEVSS